MSLPVTLLVRDFKKIYSYADVSNKTYTKEYEFPDNKVTIVFKRVWKGKASGCGVDMLGSVIVTMKCLDFELVVLISQIIKKPIGRTKAGDFPIMENITFKFV